MWRRDFNEKLLFYLCYISLIHTLAICKQVSGRVSDLMGMKAKHAPKQTRSCTNKSILLISNVSLDFHGNRGTAVSVPPSAGQNTSHSKHMNYKDSHQPFPPMSLPVCFPIMHHNISGFAGRQICIFTPNAHLLFCRCLSTRTHR